MRKIKFLQTILLFSTLTGLAGCNDSTSVMAGADKAEINLERPSKDAIILSRDISFKNNDHVSYCEVQGSNQKSYSGFRDQELYPLASLSKVVTTAWALKKLGADYTFQAEWFAKPISGEEGLFDVYLKTNNDPVFNIEKVLFLISELRHQGVKRIRTLTVDESTRVYLSSLILPHLEMQDVPVSTDESLQNLQLILNSKNWAAQKAAAENRLSRWSQKNNKSFALPDFFSADQVQFEDSRTFRPQKYSLKGQFRSAPLFKYLKNLNVYSNNYVTDALFAYLGGSVEFQKFQSQELKLGTHELRFFTGSGLAATIENIRQDNLGSCFGFLKVLNYVDRLAQAQGLNLGHFLYNPTRDLDGTFETKMNFSDQIVFKTGRLFENPALNLAGVIATRSGSVYFTFLGHGFSDSEADSIEAARDSILRDTLNFYPTEKSFLSLPEYQVLL